MLAASLTRALLATFACILAVSYFLRLRPLKVLSQTLHYLRQAAQANGEIPREWFASVSLLLSTLKISIDFYLFQAFPVIGFWTQGIPSSIDALTHISPALLWSLPFVWLGTGLTLMRLRDAGIARILVPLFFVPAINVFFFVILCLIPSRRSSDSLSVLENASRNYAASWLPESKMGIAACSVGVSTILGVAGVLLGAYGFRNYGAPLFLGLPFCMGFNAALLYGVRQYRTLGECLGIAFTASVITAITLVCLMIEGIICILALYPIVLLLCLLGAVVGYSVQAVSPRPSNQLLCSSGLTLALVLGLYLPVPTSSVLKASTSIEIAAPAQLVWKKVVAFSDISKPTEWLFLHGVAYPIRARIEGAGVGAIRYCEFSTGPFVEPITVWNEPRELRFEVTKTPPAMEEWNPFGTVISPHLEGYFASLGGQFLLSEVSPGKTQILATTWYTHQVAPEWYWQFWSDPILHIIHRRVLEHIKTQAESENQAGSTPN